MQALLFVAILIGSPYSRDAQSPAKTELEGAWIGEWGQNSGGTRIQMEPGEVVLIVRRDQIISRGLPVEFRTPSPVVLGFSLNTQTVPKQIEFWGMWETDRPPVRKQQPKKMLAVYELSGDELRLTIPGCDDRAVGPGAGGGETSSRPVAVSGDQPCSILLVFKKH
jgi:hypothetical protein